MAHIPAPGSQASHENQARAGEQRRMESLDSLESTVSGDPVRAGHHAARWTRNPAHVCVTRDGTLLLRRPEWSPRAPKPVPGAERYERYEPMGQNADPHGGGPVSTDEARAEVTGWVSMGDASALLGVSTGTLRRWAVEGRVAAFTTPGGHRRIRRSTVEALLPRRPARLTAIADAATRDQIHRAYRDSMRAEDGHAPFLDGIPTGAREPLRSHGRVIAASLVGYLQAQDADRREAALAEGMIAAAAYGRIAGTLGASMRETVATFLRFRTPFVHEMADAARRQGLDAAGATDLLEAVAVAVDRLLDATLEGYERGADRDGRPGPRRGTPR